MSDDEVLLPPDPPPLAPAAVLTPSQPADPLLHPEQPAVKAALVDTDREFAPAPETLPDDNHAELPGTDKNYDDPADANLADIANAISEGPWEAAPAPFRKRNGFPDITSESVNVRMLKDYWPVDTGRHQNGEYPRARKGDLVALPPDEAISLLEAGIAERADDDAGDSERAQKDRDEAREEDAIAVEDERKRLRDG